MPRSRSSKMEKVTQHEVAARSDTHGVQVRGVVKDVRGEACPWRASVGYKYKDVRGEDCRGARGQVW